MHPQSRATLKERLISDSSPQKPRYAIAHSASLFCYFPARSIIKYFPPASHRTRLSPILPLTFPWTSHSFKHSPESWLISLPNFSYSQCSERSHPRLAHPRDPQALSRDWVLAATFNSFDLLTKYVGISLNCLDLFKILSLKVSLVLAGADAL